jgi:hypothetical protein
MQLQELERVGPPLAGCDGIAGVSVLARRLEAQAREVRARRQPGQDVVLADGCRPGTTRALQIEGVHPALHEVVVVEADDPGAKDVEDGDELVEPAVGRSGEGFGLQFGENLPDHPRHAHGEKGRFGDALGLEVRLTLGQVREPLLEAPILELAPWHPRPVFGRKAATHHLPQPVGHGAGAVQRVREAGTEDNYVIGPRPGLVAPRTYRHHGCHTSNAMTAAATVAAPAAQYMIVLVFDPGSGAALICAVPPVSATHVRRGEILALLTLTRSITLPGDVTGEQVAKALCDGLPSRFDVRPATKFKGRLFGFGTEPAGPDVILVTPEGTSLGRAQVTVVRASGATRVRIRSGGQVLYSAFGVSRKVRRVLRDLAQASPPGSVGPHLAGGSPMQAPRTSRP